MRAAILVCVACGQSPPPAARPVPAPAPEKPAPLVLSSLTTAFPKEAFRMRLDFVGVMSVKAHDIWLEHIRATYTRNNERIELVLADMYDRQPEPFDPQRMRKTSFLYDREGTLVDHDRVFVVWSGRCRLVAEGNVSLGLLTVVPEELDWRAIDQACAR